MKKIIWIVVGLVAGLTIYNTFTLGRVKSQQAASVVLQPADEKPDYPQAPPTERLIEFSNFDYSEDLFIGNKIHIDPILSVSNVKLGKDIGDIWNDAVNSSLRYNDGNTSGGVEFTFAKFGSDIITINANANDTVYFPELFGTNALVDYFMNVDTVNGTTASITLEDTYNADSTYMSMSSTTFPFILTEIDWDFVGATTLKFNRAIIAIGDADTIALTLTRKFKLGQ